jgi:carboxymethylenebutenolidase
MISRAVPASSGKLFRRPIWWYPPPQILLYSKIEADNEGVTYMERKKATDYPQELLDHFDKYVHGDINRREFLDRANKYAVGGVSAVALWESLKPNYALAQQVPTDDARIKVGYESVSSPQGNGSIKGYYARPAKPAGKLPAVLVIHENRGLNPYIEDVARRLAVANFLAFAPDGLTSLGG